MFLSLVLVIAIVLDLLDKHVIIRLSLLHVFYWMKKGRKSNWVQFYIN